MSILDEALKSNGKTARLEIKTSEFAKDFIRKAASISGLDMTSFIISSAFEKAEAVMEKHHRIELSEQAYTRLQQILNEEPRKPSQALIDLMGGKYEYRGKRSLHD